MAGPAKRKGTDKAAAAAPTTTPEKPARPVLSLVRQAPAPPPLVFVRVDGARFVEPGIESAWQWLEKACARTGDRYRPDVVADLIRSGDFRLWLVLNGETGGCAGALVTHLCAYDSGLKCVQLMFCAGARIGRDVVVDAVEQVREYALDQDADKIEFVGARVSWLRWLRRVLGKGALGFVEFGVVGEMDLRS